LSALSRSRPDKAVSLWDFLTLHTQAVFSAWREQARLHMNLQHIKMHVEMSETAKSDASLPQLPCKDNYKNLTTKLPNIAQHACYALLVH